MMTLAKRSKRTSLAGDFRETEYQGPRYCCAITKVDAGYGA
jgi:hypothetical protein